MGYISQVEGKITGVKADTTGDSVLEVKEAIEKYLVDHKNYGGYWIDEVEYNAASEFDTQGQVTVSYYASGKAYSLRDEVEELVKILREKGFVANGEILAVGEDFGDVSKVSVKNGIVSALQKGNVRVEFTDGTEFVA